MLDWLIVGGGIHGTHLALHLLRGCGVSRERLRLLDPHAELLARWSECTENMAMQYLRSPLVHNLDLEPFALRHFARERWGRKQQKLHVRGPYERPSLELFRAHAAHLIEEHRLAELAIQGRASGLRPCKGGVRVFTDRGSLYARRVLLAISASEQPEWPDWARTLRESGAPIHHVFQPGFRRADLPEWSRAVVVGGGITAAQTAIALAQRLPGTVTLLSRHGMRVQPFDSPPGWIGPRYLTGFHRESDPARRREAIRAARHRGSMPADVASALRRAAVAGALQIRMGEVTAASLTEREVALAVSQPGAEETLQVDLLVLATGFEAGRPGGEWLDGAIERLGLPCASCGFPLVDRSLQWAAGIYVTGPLAELEIGPVARNIIGARLSAERLPRAA